MAARHNLYMRLSKPMNAVIALALLAAALLAPCRAYAISTHHPSEVLLIENADSPTSMAIARAYAASRHVSKIVIVHCIDSALSRKNETISFADYTSKIATPVSAYLALHREINFIVLTKGVPIRIDGGMTGSRAEHTTGNLQESVDSALASLDYTDIPSAKKISIHGSGADGFAWLNHYWKATAPFTHAAFGGYLVTRLDGYTQADALSLIARAANVHPDASEKVLLDVQPGFGEADKQEQPLTITSNIPDESNYGTWNADMVKAADLLRAASISVELDTTPAFIGNRDHLLGYFSWGSNDQKFVKDAYESLSFAPGSIGDTAVSTSARTFLPTNDGGQSLIADLIAHGITGVKGYTDEPLLQAIASPSIVVDRYFLSGMTLAESFYAASRFVGWEDIVIGDPLCTYPAPASRRRPAKSRAIKQP
jgi:uncharacterized protein (TIGR03790 family)